MLSQPGAASREVATRALARRSGDLVHLPRYRQRCQVKRVDREKREVTVLLGGMKLKVPFDEVTWYESL